MSAIFESWKKLKPTWRYTTKGIIWRLMPTTTGKLIGEERDIEGKRASFFCVNQMTGEVLWEGLSLGEGWWVGIEGVHRDVVYFHKFAAPDMPQHKEVIAVDILTGRELWSNSEVTFILAQGDVVFVAQEIVEGRQIYEVDYRTGAILRGWGSNEQVLRDARIRSVAPEDDEPELPTPVTDLTSDPSAVAFHIRNHCPMENLVGTVEAVDRDPVVIFNYHEKNPASTGDRLSVNNVLGIVEKGTDSVVYRDTLNANAPSLVPESFFVHGNVLFYIKERRTLTAIRIS